MMVKIINISIDEKALKVIDEAAKKEQRSRSNFLQTHAYIRAVELGVDINAK